MISVKSQKLGWGLGFFFALAAMTLKAGKIEGFATVGTHDLRREKALTEYRRSYFTSRPNPEGDQSL